MPPKSGGTPAEAASSGGSGARAGEHPPVGTALSGRHVPPRIAYAWHKQ